jgi:MoaA/NifB/PqqE/SkfB family radical SAM enzyme
MIFAALTRFIDLGIRLVGLETTVTDLDVAEGNGLDEITALAAHFHIPMIHLAFCGTTKRFYSRLGSDPTPEDRDYFLGLQSKAVEHTLFGKIRFNSVTKILDSLATRIPKTHLCNAGESVISVDLDGTIRPCFTFTGAPFYGIDPKEFDTRSYEDFREEIRLTDVGWFSSIATGCPGLNAVFVRPEEEPDNFNLRHMPHLLREINGFTLAKCLLHISPEMPDEKISSPNEYVMAW